MKVLYGTAADIEPRMELVREVSPLFPGLETEELIEELKNTVLKFIGRKEAIWVKSGEKAAGVLLFSKKHNMICCLAVSPEHRREGAASLLLTEALEQLDRSKNITVSTFRENDEKGRAARALYKKFGFEEGGACGGILVSQSKVYIAFIAAVRLLREYYFIRLAIS